MGQNYDFALCRCYIISLNIYMIWDFRMLWWFIWPPRLEVTKVHKGTKESFTAALKALQHDSAVRYSDLLVNSYSKSLRNFINALSFFYFHLFIIG